MTRYLSGNHVDLRRAPEEGKKRERDNDIGYAVQSGPLKNIGLKWRNAHTQSNFGQAHLIVLPPNNRELPKIRIGSTTPKNFPQLGCAVHQPGAVGDGRSGLRYQFPSLDGATTMQGTLLTSGLASSVYLATQRPEWRNRNTVAARLFTAQRQLLSLSSENCAQSVQSRRNFPE